jgi:molybdopterin-guanine dinucleotide biosynthesis protein A
MSFDGVVLAGGHSRRMGRDKALLPWQGQTLLERQIRVMQQAGAMEVFISCRRGAPYPSPNARVIYDEQEGLGPLAGIAAAIRQTRQTHLLVLAVDLASMTAGYLKKLGSVCLAGIGAVPWDGKHYEPLAACYPIEALPIMQRQLQGADLSMQSLLQSCCESRIMAAIKILRGEAGLFRNWNSPEDIASAEAGPLPQNP